MLKPHYQKLCDWIHAHTAWKVFLHSCGSVADLLPDLIEVGIDILDPIQPEARGMNPYSRAKARKRGLNWTRLPSW